MVRKKSHPFTINISGSHNRHAKRDYQVQHKIIIIR